MGVAGQLIDHTEFQPVIDAQGPAFHQQRQGLLQPQHAHQSHGAAATRKQTEGDFRQAQSDLATIDCDAMVTGQAQLQATAQCRTLDGGHHRFAECFQRAKLGFEVHGHLVESGGAGGVNLAQLVEVSAGKERFLRRADDHTGDGLFVRQQAFKGLRHGLAIRRVHGIGLLAGHVDGQRDDLIRPGFVADGIAHAVFLPETVIG
ncbi:hypothetical protein AO263_08315 [Pseudomonas sp. NZIPFR-PS5]|nr:hypothetical protein AO263_08315 [Pseudomonas sp. NZIPFR-PS5]